MNSPKMPVTFLHRVHDVSAVHVAVYDNCTTPTGFQANMGCSFQLIVSISTLSSIGILA